MGKAEGSGAPCSLVPTTTMVGMAESNVGRVAGNCGFWVLYYPLANPRRSAQVSQA